ncbi:MAG: hypothetical protein LBG19_02090 [Prevotellaceae bacterium]|nr:hypothetical protein [Prevotellaceae bacterium]
MKAVEISTTLKGDTYQIGVLAPALYFLELVMFLLPVYSVVKTKYFFCERCKETLFLKTAYISDVSLVNENIDNLKSGKALFLKDVNPVFSVEGLGIIYKAYMFNFYFCFSCRSVVVSVEKISLKRDENNAFTIADSEEIIKGVHWDEESSELAFKKITLDSTVKIE